jgi:hypothetical protein
MQLWLNRGRFALNVGDNRTDMNNRLVGIADKTGKKNQEELVKAEKLCSFRYEQFAPNSIWTGFCTDTGASKQSMAYYMRDTWRTGKN